MLTDEDIKKLSEVLATKKGIDRLSVEVVTNREEIQSLRQDVGGLREAIQSLITSVDKLAKAVDDLRTEYAAITNQVGRHEKWLHQIAEKLGIKLEI
jgi:uncharacterized coiled-coil DUF342 family protein